MPGRPTRPAAGRTIVVTLDPAERFDRLVITVEHPAETVDAINSALGAP